MVYIAQIAVRRIPAAMLIEVMLSTSVVVGCGDIPRRKQGTREYAGALNIGSQCHKSEK